MENLEEKVQEPQNSEQEIKNRDKNSFSFSATVIITCMILSIASGFISGWLFTERKVKVPNFVTIDAISLLEAQKAKLIEKYGSKEMTAAVQTEINKETSSFIEKLKIAIAESSDGKIVLTRDAVIAGDKLEDITDEVAKKVNLSINNSASNK